MAQPFLSEIRIFSFSYAPKGWALCNGQILPISQNQALFSLLGTIYGGNGVQTFGLPNLQGRASLGPSNVHPLGQVAGEASHVLTVAEMPSHRHTAMAKDAAGDSTLNGTTPTGRTLAEGLVSLPQNKTTPAMLYGGGAANRTMSNSAFTNAGGGQPHENMQPYLVLNFCIALQGIFPSRN